MRTSITLGKKDGQYRAIIIEGNGSRESDTKTLIPLQGDSSTSEDELIQQLPTKYKKQIESGEADLVTIY